jgi:DNA-binding beta-propeller fold protein YncE
LRRPRHGADERRARQRAGREEPGPRRTRQGVVIRIPRPRRRAHYISPSTKAMKIDFTGPSTIDETIPLTPTSPGCSQSGGVTTCVVTLQLLPGNYIGTLSTYDSTDVGTAKLLSTGQQVPFSIANGIVNTVSFVLAGVPAKIAVTPSSTTYVVSSSGTFGIYGLQKQIFVATALDADGNVIAGSGAPTFKVSISGTLPLTLGPPPSATQPNAFTLTVKPPWPAGATGTLTVQAAFASGTNGCAQTGANCTGSFTIQARQLLAVGNDFRNTTQVFDLASGGGATLVATLRSAHPMALLFDANGNLFVGNDQNENVVKYAFGTYAKLAQYDVGRVGSLAILPNQSTLYVANGRRVVPVNLSTGVVGLGIRAGEIPRALAVSADGSTLYAANQDSSDVTVISTAINLPVKTVHLPTHCTPVSLAIGATYLFVPCGLTNEIRQIDLATLTLLHRSAFALSPVALALDSNGLLYSADYSTASITQFNTNVIPLRRLGHAFSGHQPIAEAIDGSNLLYVVNRLSSNVRVLNASRTSLGTITTSAFPISDAIYP